MSVLTTTSWVALLFVLAATARIRHAHNNSTHTLTVPLGSCAEGNQGIKNHFLRSKLASGGTCPNCLQNHEDEDEKDFVDRSEEIRLEAIKHQILSKLGLRAKPNISRESSPSRDVVLQTLRRANGWPFNSYSSSRSYDPDTGHNDDFFATTSEIIAFAEQGPRLNGQRLVEFLPPGEGPELRVKSAILWIRLEPRSTPPQRNVTLWAFRLKHLLPNATHLSGKEFNTHTEVAGYTKVAPLTVWQKLDLRQTVLDWYTHRSGERLRLLIDCSGCNGAVVPSLFRSGPSNRPFLVVTTEPSPSRRVRRRALDCSGATGGQCCKEMFYVNFKQLGWDDWVIAPNGYFANYCRGDCSELRTPDEVVNSHSHLLEEYRRMNQVAGLQPCCTPVKFSSTSLIYYGPKKNIIKRDLPKMVVEECGCP